MGARAGPGCVRHGLPVRAPALLRPQAPAAAPWHWELHPRRWELNPGIGSCTPGTLCCSPGVGCCTPGIGCYAPGTGSCTPSIESCTPAIGWCTSALGAAPPALRAAPPLLGGAPRHWVLHPRHRMLHPWHRVLHPALGAAPPALGAAPPALGAALQALCAASPALGAAPLPHLCSHSHARATPSPQPPTPQFCSLHSTGAPTPSRCSGPRPSEGFEATVSHQASFILWDWDTGMGSAGGVAPLACVRRGKGCGAGQKWQLENSLSQGWACRVFVGMPRGKAVGSVAVCSAFGKG